MNIQVDITERFHLPDGSHGFAGEIYHEQDQLLAEFVNPGMGRRWAFYWADGDAFLKLAGEAIKTYPKSITQSYDESVKQWILDLLVQQERSSVGV